MLLSLAKFSLLFLLGLGFVTFAWVTACRLSRGHERSQLQRWLISWSLKGLVVPLVIWAAMNFGLSFQLQPFMPQVQAAQSAGRWFPAFLTYTAFGLFVISTFWTAMTLGQVVYQTGTVLEGAQRDDFRGLCWTSVIGMSIPAIIIIFLGGWFGIGLAVMAMLTPIAGYAPTILQAKKKPPMYAKAIARMKFGKYAEAEEEVIRQLENCEDDFEGWLMLADLYANHFNDLPEAEQTILEICDQPRTNPSQLSIALHRLADWHLKLAGDPDAARRALLMICDRLPGTHLARVARLRAENLPRTAEEWREQQQNKPIHLPALGDPLDDDGTASAPTINPAEAAKRANQLSKRLGEDPNDVATREELARVFADQLGRADAAIEQVNLLLDMPDQPPEKRAHWLGLIATWHLRHRHDADAAREVLEKLIHEYPNTALAFTARRRLTQMEIEKKLRLPRPAPKKIKIEPGPVRPSEQL
jgi:tetratricopeptide (TPR) repeat protein